MLRRHHRLFRTSQMLRDAAVAAASFYIAVRLRFGFPEALPFAAEPSGRETLEVAVTAAALWPWSGWLAGLYVSRRSQSFAAEAKDVLRAAVLAFVSLSALAYFVTDGRYSRGVLLFWLLSFVPSLLCVRWGQKWLLGRLRARGINLRHVLVVGTGSLAEHVAEVLRAERSLGLELRGVVALEGEASTPTRVAGAPVLGTVSQVAQLVRQHGVDQVVVALAIHEMGALPALMERLSRETVDVRMVPDFHQYVTLCGGIEDFFGMPLVHLQGTRMDGLGRAAKRAFDLVLATVLGALFAPVFAAVTLAIAAERQGPIFYRQTRIGLDGQPFAMLKFRTMRTDAERTGARMTAVGDPRCTRLGRLLRRLSLDETPQLLNVLRGEMSLVGPRPEQPNFSDLFRQKVPRYALRHKIKAGMTGWAQVNGLRGNTSITKRIELDLYYIENWSLVLDVKILLRTLLGGFLSPHAY